MPFQFQPPVIVHAYKAEFPKAELWIPYISGGPDDAAVHAVNEHIRQSAQELVNGQGSLDDPRAEMFGYFEVKNNQKDVLSLSLFNYAYTGGAHGMTLQQSLTFDVPTGKLYSLSELFKPGSDYVKRLSALVAKQIAARQIETLEPFKAIRPDQSFYVADRSLVLYFNLYELAAYVYGFLYFPISVYSIQSIIDEQGPLGKMLES
ncbi:DUF3298 and DUF4163 domain-containing protein [Paenibacillus thailandensis]|uniref:DUF3298 and DUF4163 domain-containing protein n=1 Tax=Paenibacillus thailandensis TaxID=393250 RepID=A0ABW5QU89_9BACL